MSKRIGAVTQSSGYKYYPQYVLVNEDDSGRVRITVRGPENARGDCGIDATVTLTAEEFAFLLSEFRLRSNGS